MTATSLGLGGEAIKFLGAYVVGVNTTLGLEQSPSTCQITLVEDLNPTPLPGHSPSPVVFQPPEVGSFQTITVGSLTFAGIVMSYRQDIVSIGGRQITVSLSDSREIMKSIPIIIGPGYQLVADEVKKTGCSLIDAFGAYSAEGFASFVWNQSGMIYSDVARTFQGGSITIADTVIKVSAQFGKAFGEKYLFDLSEVTARVDEGYRVNTNLVTVADFIQEVAGRHSFDWFVESERNQQHGHIDVKVRIIDRSADNIDLDIDEFLAANSGFVIEASRGFELRNDLACPVVVGAPIEAQVTRTCLGMANNPIDLSSEGGFSKYFMNETEMRYVLSGKEHWKILTALEAKRLGKSIGEELEIYGITKVKLGMIIDPREASDIKSPARISTDRMEITESDEKIVGLVYDKLLGHAKATYGKRFMFTPVFDAETIDAAWTGDDVISGNNDPNEYFRNSDGKTRCYVEFAAEIPLTPTVPNPPSFTAFTIGENAPVALPLELRNEFQPGGAITEVDKADWILQGTGFTGTNLYVAATIEEGNVVKLDAPIIDALGNPSEIFDKIKEFEKDEGGESRTGKSLTSVSTRRQVQRVAAAGLPSNGSIHQKAFQPSRIFVPIQHRYLRYGPVFPSKLRAESEGKVVIDQDDGFAPWEFGSQQTMFDAMKFKVDNAASEVKTVESASISVEGFPKLGIGESLGKNSNINGINVSFSSGGVTTSYELRSFLRGFGELSKQELGFLSLIARRGGARIFPQDAVSFISRFRPIISKQFAGRGSSSSSAISGGASNFE